jgi:dimeric dUTPase (all-alpha-NTP-PPase superfamily)
MMQIGLIKDGSDKTNNFKYLITTPQNLVFTLIPIEGAANLYVHPGYLPKEPNQFAYVSTSQTAKKVIVSKEYMEGMRVNSTVKTTYSVLLCTGPLPNCLQVPSQIQYPQR